MKFVLIAFLLLGIASLDAVRLCRDNVRNESDKIYSDGCPIMTAPGFDYNGLLDCKIRHGFEVRKAFQTCADQEFKDPALRETEVIKRTACNSSNIDLAHELACCVFSVSTTDKLDSKALLQITKNCSENINY